MHRSIGYFGIIILLLAACTPTTVSPTLTTPDATDAPALQPAPPTSTPERVFATDTPKDGTANSETESNEPRNNASSHPDVEMDDAVFIYERAGGLKGIGPSIITWTMYPDGHVVSSDGRSWQVPADDITTLVDSIMELGFADFETSYIPEDTCCDRATHTITIQQGDEIYQVSVLDSADAPAELYQALDFIGEFLIALPT